MVDKSLCRRFKTIENIRSELMFVAYSTKMLLPAADFFDFTGGRARRPLTKEEFCKGTESSYFKTLLRGLMATLLLWLPVIPGKDKYSYESMWDFWMDGEPFPTKANREKNYGKAHRDLAKELHPDKSDSEFRNEQMEKLNTITKGKQDFKNVWSKTFPGISFPKGLFGNDDFPTAHSKYFQETKDPEYQREEWAQIGYQPERQYPTSVMDNLYAAVKNQSWFKHKFYYLAAVIALATAFTLHKINTHDTEKTEFQQGEKNLFKTISLSEIYARHPQLNRTEDLRDFLLKEHGELPAIVLFDTDGNERDNEGIAKAFHVYHHHNNSGNVTRTKSTRTKSRSRSLSRSRSRSRSRLSK